MLGLPLFLYKGVTDACFHSFGNVFVERDKLNRYVSEELMHEEHSRSVRFVIILSAVVLDTGNLDSALKTSCSDKGWKSKIG